MRIKGIRISADTRQRSLAKQDEPARLRIPGPIKDHLLLNHFNDDDRTRYQVPAEWEKGSDRCEALTPNNFDIIELPGVPGEAVIKMFMLPGTTGKLKKNLNSVSGRKRDKVEGSASLPAQKTGQTSVI